MPILDIILLLCFVPAIVGGLTKGFVRQAAGLVAVLLAAWAAFHFTPALSAWLGRHITLEPNVLNVLSFVLLIIAASLLLDLAAAAVANAFKLLSLGFFNRILGLVFAVLRTALILGLLILLVETLNTTLHLLQPASTQNAVVYHALKDFAEQLFPILKTFVNNASTLVHA